MATERRTIGRSGHVSVADRNEAISPTAQAIGQGTVSRLRLQEVVTSERPLYNVTKRAFDIAVALAAILAALPVLIAIAVLIKLDSPGPVLFRQERLGKDARRFTMLKFRSMRVTSDHIPAGASR